MFNIVTILLLQVPLWNNGLADDDVDGTESEFEHEVELSQSLASLKQGPRSESLLVTTELAIAGEFSLLEPVFGSYVLSGSIEKLDSQPGQNTSHSVLELQELWLGWQVLENSDSYLWVGRHALADAAAWWWDYEFTGIGVQYGKTYNDDTSLLQLALDFSSDAWSSEETQSDPEEDSILSVLGSFRLPLRNGTKLTTFFIHHQDNSEQYTAGQPVSEASFDEIDADLSWLGLRLERHFVFRQLGVVSALFDAAYIRGQQTRAELAENDDALELEDDSAKPESLTIDEVVQGSISAWGTQLMLTWTPSFADNNTLIFGYAYGSGTGQGHTPGSRTFQQTGFHGNENNRPYYGRLFNPELANLEITSIALSHSFKESAEAYIQYNSYRRASAFDDTLGSELDMEFASSANEVGSEISVGMDLALTPMLTLALSATRFNLGKALSDASSDASGTTNRSAELYELAISYEF